MPRERRRLSFRMSRTSSSDGWAWKKPDGELVPLRGDVRFQDVVFRYVPEKTILHGISLYAKPGQKIAFVELMWLMLPMAGIMAPAKDWALVALQR